MEKSAFVRSYEFCSEMPQKLTADDGREFLIQKWQPLAEVGSLSHVECRIVPNYRQMKERQEQEDVQD